MESQNVTLRRHKLNRSLDDICLEKSLSYEEDLKSLPDLSTMNCEFDELKEKMNTLQSLLDSANNEIDNLILENNSLKKKIMELEKKLLLFNKIYTEPKSNKKIKHFSSLNILKIKRRIDFDAENNEMNINSPKKNPPVLEKSNFCSKNKKHELKATKKERLFIFGGQQCVGLASRLHASKYDLSSKYQISSITKPFASTDNIVESCYKIEPDASDYFVLSLGEHDKNPLDFISETASILRYLKNANIIILYVVKNLYLNEILINNYLKQMCQRYPKCIFLNAYENCNANTFQDNYLDRICYKIKTEINFLHYRNEFLVGKNWLNNLKSKNKIQTCNTNLKSNYFKETSTQIDNSLLCININCDKATQTCNTETSIVNLDFFRT
ncbi:uncharacterized protein LOC123706448 [Colias croceus]|uniref:uncharacterized protein LOC123706448 n=1 Tax=Colias crocea TaxID=72248 RepID=UPI001E27D986|nr:uncharacterized protein LOC123706448 [Colias croceus]